MHQVFISYARHDAKVVAPDLEALNVEGHDVFIDTSRMRAGDHLEARIRESIVRADEFRVYWSYRAARRPWVLREIAWALAESKARSPERPLKVVPVCLDATPLPKELSSFHAVTRRVPSAIDARSALGLLLSVALLLRAARSGGPLVVAVILVVASVLWLLAQYTNSVARYVLVRPLDAVVEYCTDWSLSRIVRSGAALVARIWGSRVLSVRGIAVSLALALRRARHLARAQARLVELAARERTFYTRGMSRHEVVERAIVPAVLVFVVCFLVVHAGAACVRLATRRLRHTYRLRGLGTMAAGLALGGGASFSIVAVASSFWLARAFAFPFPETFESLLWHAGMLCSGRIDPIRAVQSGAVPASLIAGALASLIASIPVDLALATAVLGLVSRILQRAPLDISARAFNALASDPRGPFALLYLLLMTSGALEELWPVPPGSAVEFAHPVPAGRYWLGAMNDEELARAGSEGRSMPFPGTEKAAQVLIAHSFELSATEVTQGQWKELLARRRDLSRRFALPAAPWTYSGDDLPVETVSFCDAVKFVNLWSMVEDRRPAYYDQNDGEAVMAPPGSGSAQSADTNDWFLPNCGQPLWSAVSVDAEADGYRLPTEEEWEAAARFGSLDPVTGGNALAIHDEPMTLEVSGLHPHRVAETRADPLGLFDMLGNVSELEASRFPWEYNMNGPDLRGLSLEGELNGSGVELRGGDWARRAVVSGPEVRLNGTSRYATSARIGFRVLRPHVDRSCRPSPECAVFDVSTCRCVGCARATSASDGEVAGVPFSFRCDAMAPGTTTQVQFAAHPVVLAKDGTLLLGTFGHRLRAYGAAVAAAKRARDPWTRGPWQALESLKRPDEFFEGSRSLLATGCSAERGSAQISSLLTDPARRADGIEALEGFCRLLAEAGAAGCTISSRRQLSDWVDEKVGDESKLDATVHVVAGDNAADMRLPANLGDAAELLVKASESGVVEFVATATCRYDGQECALKWESYDALVLETPAETPRVLRMREQAHIDSVGSLLWEIRTHY